MDEEFARTTQPASSASGPAPAGAPAPAPPARETVIGQGIAWSARWSLRWVAIALGAVVLGLVVSKTWSILLPVFLALVICTVLAPISNFLRDRWHVAPAVAAALAIVIPLLGLFGVAYLLAPSVAGQSNNLVDSTVEGLESVQDWVREQGFVSSGEISAGVQALQDRLQDSGGAIASGVLSGVATLTSAVVTLIVSLVLTFLFLKDGRSFIPWVRRLTGEKAGSHLAEVLHRCWSTLGGFIRAQSVVSLVDAVFIGAGLLIVGVPLAIPLAVLTFFAGFVPIVGAFVAGVVAVLVALVSVGLKDALIVLGIILVVQQLESNVLSPMLQSNAMRLHSAVVLLSVILGSTLFGIAGGFFAVPAAAMAGVVLRYLDEQTTQRSRPREAEVEPETSQG